MSTSQFLVDLRNNPSDSSLKRRLEFTTKNLDYRGLYTPINRVYFQKFIQYGNFIDLTTYKTIRLSYKNPARSFVRRKQPKTTRSIQRTRENLYRLVEANVDKYRENLPIFATLTFKRNEQHIPTAYSDFRLFIQRLNYHHDKKIQYVAVPEFQDRGAIHFHLIFFNLPFTPVLVFENIWGHGYTNIQTCKKIGAASSYLLKYLTKELFDNERLCGVRSVLSSRNLARPVLSFDSYALDDIKERATIKTLSVWENKYIRKSKYKLC